MSRATAARTCFCRRASCATSLELLGEIIEHTRGLVVSLGLPLLHNKAVFNACALVADAKLLGFAAKRALAGDGIHYEPRWFKPWPRGERGVTKVAGRDVPDWRRALRLRWRSRSASKSAKTPGSPSGPERELSLRRGGRDPQPIGEPLCLRKEGSTSPPRARGLAGLRRHLRLLQSRRQRGRSRHLRRGRADRVGGPPGGRLTALFLRDLEHDLRDHRRRADTHPRTDGCRAFSRRWKPRPASASASITSIHRLGSSRRTWRSPPGKRGNSLKEEEFVRAESLALFDYLRKSRSRGFVVSLSGGADSAAVACLVSMAVRFALRELGLDGVRERLAYVEGVAECRDRARSRRACCSPPPTKRRATAERSRRTRPGSVAEAIGARHFELDVDAMVEGYVTARGRGARSRPLTWEQDDIALQNIQARVRAPSVWLLANLTGALLLATSNRSEAAVGYATMDGDTAGGLSPDRRHRQGVPSTVAALDGDHGSRGLRAHPGARRRQRSSSRPPSCRPAAAGQTDEGDLMPYVLLDAIERAAIRDKRSPLDVWELMRAEFPGYETQQLLTWVVRFFRLFAATSGSASATPRVSTWTTRASTPRRGAGSRS